MRNHKVFTKEELEFECQKLIQRNKVNEAFTPDEIESTTQSLKNIASDKNIDYYAFADFISKEAHLNFKQSFKRTLNASQKLSELLSGPSNPHFKKMFLRVLQEGNWVGAETLAFDQQNSVSPTRKSSKPWAGRRNLIYP
jgi:hypothetical protein